MTFDEAMRAAAKHADAAVKRSMSSYAKRRVYDEDDISGYLVGQLDAEFNNASIGGLKWQSAILRHRKGKAAEEKRIGADMLFHVEVKTRNVKYSKGILVQAKKVGPHRALTAAGRKELTSQCNRMLRITPAAFVFDYAKEGMRCDPAIKVAGGSYTNLYDQCGWTSYRFFRELFRCPIGDKRITSARVDRLPVSGGLALTAEEDTD